MKKSIVMTILSVLFLTSISFNAVAQEKDKDIADQVYKNEFKESEMHYRQVNVYKVLDQKDAYIVMHQKGHREVSSVVIPKKWYKEHPARLRFRPLQPGMSPYMTVFYKNADFAYVILTVPLSRDSSYWGVADAGVEVDTSSDTLDIKY